MTLEKQLITLINQTTSYRRVFHLAYTGRLPRYSQVRHSGLVTLVEQHREILADVHRNLTGSGKLAFHPDPDFDLLAGGAWSCWEEQYWFDASLDHLYNTLANILNRQTDFLRASTTALTELR
ncbi:hypothetical protein OKC80_24180 [Escherichia coli]|uniref:hypothetical protein n=1 Tax=Escherichia coli TaxID=562 RepID=UPI002220E584|nr:hypothetical protein [Escherichia coli]MCW1141395.1 hypothetical protein [Escherichia coli]